jgi:hypothetical protein
MDDKKRTLCSKPDCKRTTHARGYCKMHYKRAVKAGEFAGVRKRNPTGGVKSGLPCQVEGCDKPRIASGYCRSHYGRVRIAGNPQPEKPIAQRFERGEGTQCKLEWCDQEANAAGYCRRHYEQVRRGTPPTPLGTRSKREGGWAHPRRIYPDSPTVSFAVRVRKTVAGEISALAKERGESEITIKRMIVSVGIEALEKQLEAQT